MMIMRHFLLGALMVGVLATSGRAETVDQAIVAELHQQGYTSVKVSKTWLGRIFISANLDGGYREIVINPQTGEILRDYSRGAVQMVDDDRSDPKSTVTADEGGDPVERPEDTTIGIAGGDTSDEPQIEVLPKEVVTVKEQP